MNLEVRRPDHRNCLVVQLAQNNATDWVIKASLAPSLDSSFAQTSDRLYPHHMNTLESFRSLPT